MHLGPNVPAQPCLQMTQHHHSIIQPQCLCKSTFIASAPRTSCAMSTKPHTYSLLCVGSEPVAELAELCRPRYHFAGTKNTFYARPPYMNPDLGAGGLATRFIGLASVGNMTKQKSLHALGLVPAASMDLEALQQKPEVGLLSISSITGVCSALKRMFVSSFEAYNGSPRWASQGYMHCRFSAQGEQLEILQPNLDMHLQSISLKSAKGLFTTECTNNPTYDM